MPVYCPCGQVDETGVGFGKCESRGLGDTVANLTAAVGIAPCCGCEQRKDLLNWLVPYSLTDFD